MKQSIVILTGAGVSAESGLKTFRDSDGLWRGNNVEDLATTATFGRNPSAVHDFYNERRRHLHTVNPNAAHFALTELQQFYGDQLSLVTQNVDDLHERAGFQNPLHIHGEILRKRCTWCGIPSECLDDIQQVHVCDHCSRPGGLRPDVVWFGETPQFLKDINESLSKADLFIAIGTSGHVFPAARFVETAKLHGAYTMELNKETTKLSESFDELRTGLATETVPALVKDLIS